MENAFVMIAEATANVGRFFSSRMRLLLRCAVASVLAAAVLAPILLSAGSMSAARSVYGLEAALCHQAPDRCLAFAGEPAALCARCLGGFLGFLLTSFLFTAKSDPKRIFRVAVAVFAVAGVIDVGLHTVGLYDTGNMARFLSGLGIGSGPGMVIFRFIGQIEIAENC